MSPLDLSTGRGEAALKSDADCSGVASGRVK